MLGLPPVRDPDPGFVAAEVPHGQDDGGEDQQAEDLVAAEGAGLLGAAGFGVRLFEVGLDAVVGHRRL